MSEQSDTNKFRFVERYEHPHAVRSRTSHKKSHTGCQRCRTRRVKCDEVKPICSNCKRLKFTCSYEQQGSTQIDLPEADTTGDLARLSLEHQPLPGLDTRHSQHQLELRLLHTYDTITCPTIYMPDDDTAAAVCISDVPRLAFANTALLNSIFSFTALHLAELHPEERAGHMIVHHNYHAAALRDHAKDVGSLNVDTYDAACMTSMFIRMDALVMLQKRPLEPYTPPLDWFDVTRGAMEVFSISIQWAADNDSASNRMRNRMPFVFDTKAKFDASNQQPFKHLLQAVDGTDLQDQDLETQAAYQNTVSYIGGIWQSLDEISFSEFLRRLILLPYLTDPHFRTLLKDLQPRALLIMAHYFAMLSKLRHIWWIGDSGEREVHALTSLLSGDWRSLAAWAIQLVTP